MNVLRDECLDWRLGRELPGHDVKTVQEMGWNGIKNGDLLALAQKQFDVFITGDRNLSSQQDLGQFSIAVVILRAESIRPVHTRALMPKVLAAIPSVQPGTVTVISAR